MSSLVVRGAIPLGLRGKRGWEWEEERKRIWWFGSIFLIDCDFLIKLIENWYLKISIIKQIDQITELIDLI